MEKLRLLSQMDQLLKFFSFAKLLYSLLQVPKLRVGDSSNRLLHWIGRLCADSL